MESANISFSKIGTGPIIAAIVFLILIIFSGRILNEINKSNCKTDANITSAHRWASWAVGLSTMGLIISVVFIILAAMVVTHKDGGTMSGLNYVARTSKITRTLD